MSEYSGIMPTLQEPTHLKQSRDMILPRPGRSTHPVQALDQFPSHLLFALLLLSFFGRYHVSGDTLGRSMDVFNAFPDYLKQKITETPEWKMKGIGGGISAIPDEPDDTPF